MPYKEFILPKIGGEAHPTAWNSNTFPVDKGELPPAYTKAASSSATGGMPKSTGAGAPVRESMSHHQFDKEMAALNLRLVFWFVLACLFCWGVIKLKGSSRGNGSGRRGSGRRRSGAMVGGLSEKGRDLESGVGCGFLDSEHFLAASGKNDKSKQG